MWRPLRRLQSWKPWKLVAALATRGKPQVQEVRHSYHSAGITIAEEPIPWNADQVQVTAVVRLSGVTGWCKTEFSLHLPDGSRVAPAAAEQEQEDTVHLSFTLPPPRKANQVRVSWRDSALAELALPVLTAEEFLGNLRLDAPTLLARLHRGLVPCEAAVACQLQGLLACGMLTSSSSLMPLLDLGVAVEFTDTDSGRVQSVAAALPRSEARGRRAFVSATPPSWPQAGETWSVRWLVADRCLAERRFRVLSQEQLLQSLYLIDGRYACLRAGGALSFHPYLPGRSGLGRIGPCFRVASSEPGAAGWCTLDLHTRFKDPERPPQALRQEVLVTDGPSLFQPTLLNPADFEQVWAFELHRKGQVLGTLPGCRPVLHFTSEGGFRELTQFDWTPVPEEELNERLRRLTEVPEPSPVA
jgi:hypothetical protein